MIVGQQTYTALVCHGHACLANQQDGLFQLSQHIPHVGSFGLSAGAGLIQLLPEFPHRTHDPHDFAMEDFHVFFKFSQVFCLGGGIFLQI